MTTDTTAASDDASRTDVAGATTAEVGIEVEDARGWPTALLVIDMQRAG